MKGRDGMKLADRASGSPPRPSCEAPENMDHVCGLCNGYPGPSMVQAPRGQRLQNKFICPTAHIYRQHIQHHHIPTWSGPSLE